MGANYMGKHDVPKYRLGIDLGGTKMHAVVINRKGKVLGAARRAGAGERRIVRQVRLVGATVHPAHDRLDQRAVPP